MAKGSRHVTIETWQVSVGVQCPAGEPCTAIIVAVDDRIPIILADRYYASGKGDTTREAVADAFRNLADKLMERDHGKDRTLEDDPGA